MTLNDVFEKLADNTHYEIILENEIAELDKNFQLAFLSKNSHDLKTQLCNVNALPDKDKVVQL